MAFQLSPGVNVSEIDLSTVIPAVATSTGGFAGPFAWGPADEVVTLTNENQLRDRFGRPRSANNQYQYWFTAANFLSYSNNLKVVRSIPTGALNATGNTGLLIKNSTDYEINYSDGTTADIATYGSFAAKYPGDLGNGLLISICPNSNAFEQVMSSNTSTWANTDSTTVNTAADLTNTISVGDVVSISKSGVSTEFNEVVGITATTITVKDKWSVNVATNANITRKWKYYKLFGDKAPQTSAKGKEKGATNDEMHVVIVDTLGREDFSGAKNTVLEKFAFVSKGVDARLPDNTDNYYKTVLNNSSKYVWWLNKPSIGSSNWDDELANTAFTESVSSKNYYVTLQNGADGEASTANLVSSFDVLGNAENVDVSLIMAGPANSVLASKIVQIAETRKDCMAFISPLEEHVINNYGNELKDVLAYRNGLLTDQGLLLSSSYAVMDSGWKYQFDKYNNQYVWVPLNGDIAGITARADVERDPWFSPAGINRGVLRNVVKLAWNPNKAERDELYMNEINPVVSFPGEGVVLYGDKTLLDRPSAFDRINVRRLFIVLEKAIAKAARSTLFEFNDQFTRSQFVALVEPYLRDVQGRRGITDFRVVCDETNNTPEVVDSNRFVGDIYIKPARSINFIQLNFVAVRTGVAFSEIVGQF